MTTDSLKLEARLQAHAFVADFPPADIALLAQQATVVNFTPGQFLLREGTAATTFFLIENGVVVIETAATASAALSVARVTQGAVVGYSWLFPPYRNGFDALALTAVNAIAIEGVPIRFHAERDPVFGYRLLQRFANVMLERLQATRRQMLDVYAHLNPTSSAD